MAKGLKKFVDFPTSPQRAVGIILVAAIGTALLGGLGLLSPLTQLAGRAGGSIRGVFLKVTGLDRRTGGAA